MGIREVQLWCRTGDRQIGGGLGTHTRSETYQGHVVGIAYPDEPGDYQHRVTCPSCGKEQKYKIWVRSNEQLDRQERNINLGWGSISAFFGCAFILAGISASLPKLHEMLGFLALTIAFGVGTLFVSRYFFRLAYHPKPREWTDDDRVTIPSQRDIAQTPLPHSLCLPSDRSVRQVETMDNARKEFPPASPALPCPRVEIPDGWEPRPDPGGVASLKYGDTKAETFFTVVMDKKEAFATFQLFSDAAFAAYSKNQKLLKREGPSSMVIDEREASFWKLVVDCAASPPAVVFYILIDGCSGYYQLILVGLERDAAKNAPLFKRIVDSFHEARTPSPIPN